MTKREAMWAADGRAGGVGLPSLLELRQFHHDLQMLVTELQDLTSSLVEFWSCLV